MERSPKIIGMDSGTPTSPERTLIFIIIIIIIIIIILFILILKWPEKNPFRRPARPTCAFRAVRAGIRRGALRFMDCTVHIDTFYF